MIAEAGLIDAQRLPVDAADVPLQRLGLHVGRDRRRRARTSACPRSTRRRSGRAIGREGITHLCAAPTVRDDAARRAEAAPCPAPVRLFIGGAPPSPTLLDRAARLGIEVTHLYGLTETYGPLAVCAWNPGWDDLPTEDQARLRARQGVGDRRHRADPRGRRRHARRPRRRRDARRGRHARQQRDARLLPRPRGHPRGVRRRLVPLRRPRGRSTRTATSSCATG